MAEIADGAEERAPKLAARQAGVTSCGVIHARTDAAGIGEDLAERKERGEDDGKFEAHKRVQSDSYGDAAYG